MADKVLAMSETVQNSFLLRQKPYKNLCGYVSNRTKTADKERIFCHTSVGSRTKIAGQSE
jgi:hypothetical protein